MQKVILFLFIILSATISHATSSVETCGEISGPVGYKYCYTTYEKSAHENILFYLHGGGGDEHEWTKISQEITAQWATQGATAPIVVNISFGPYWLLVGKNAAPHSGLLDVFKYQVIPQMENLVLGKPAKKRWLLGLSMGGFNSTQVLANLPAGTFARAMLVCPAIVNLSPWASNEEITDYVKAHGSDFNTLTGIAQIAQPFVPDTQTWNSSISPFTLLPAISANSSLLFIATNKDDKTFEYGGSLLAQQLSVLKPDLIFEKWPGVHCQLDGAAIADFFSH